MQAEITDSIAAILAVLSLAPLVVLVVGAVLIALLAAGDLTFGGMLYSDARPFSQRTTIYLINALAVVAFVGKLALGTGLILVARAILRKASQNQAVEATP